MDLINTRHILTLNNVKASCLSNVYLNYIYIYIGIMIIPFKNDVFLLLDIQYLQKHTICIHTYSILTYTYVKYVYYYISALNVLYNKCIHTNFILNHDSS